MPPSTRQPAEQRVPASARAIGARLRGADRQHVRCLALLGLLAVSSLAAPTAAHAQPSAPTLRLYAGMLRPVVDQWHFDPCDSSTQTPRRARDLSPESSLTAILTDIGLDRREATYIEAWGREEAGEVHFLRLNRAGAEMGCASASASAPQRHWQAQGNEPFWALRSDVQGLSLRQPGSQLNVPPLTLRWQRRDSDPHSVATLSARTEMTALDITLVPRLCKDSMADAAYGFHAELVLTRPFAARFEGCAWLGSEQPPWVRAEPA